MMNKRKNQESTDQQPTQKKQKLHSVFVKLCPPDDPAASEIPAFIFENGRSVNQHTGALCDLNDPDRITYGRRKQAIYAQQLSRLQALEAAERQNELQLQQAAQHEEEIERVNSLFVHGSIFGPKQWPPSPRLPTPLAIERATLTNDSFEGSESSGDDGYESEQENEEDSQEREGLNHPAQDHNPGFPDFLAGLFGEQPQEYTRLPTSPEFPVIPQAPSPLPQLFSLSPQRKEIPQAAPSPQHIPASPKERPPSPLPQHFFTSKDRNEEVVRKLQAMLERTEAETSTAPQPGS